MSEMGRGAISKRSWSQTMNDSSTDPQTMISNKKQKFEETAKAANFSVSFEEYLKNVLEKAIPHFSVEAELFAKEETIRKMENHMANVPEHLKKAFAMEERISSEKRNLLKLLSKRYRLLNPVSLCPSLYSEVLANAIAENSAVMPDYEKAKKIITTIFNVGMSGKDGFFAMAQLFKKLRTLFFADNFAGIKFECSYFDFPLIVNNSKEIKDLLLKILEMGIPHVTKVHFSTSSRPWVQLFFAILAKHPQQTKLDIHGNVGADFVVPRTVEKLARRGVMIGLRSQSQFLLYSLSFCHLESFELKCNNLHMLENTKCTFRKLEITNFVPNGLTKIDFRIGFIEEVCAKYLSIFADFKDLFREFKRVFPNAKKLVFQFRHNSVEFNNLKNCMDDFKKAVIRAPQKEVQLFIKSQSSFHSELVVKHLNGQKIEKNIYEWKAESNEKKSIKLEFCQNDSSNQVMDFPNGIVQQNEIGLGDLMHHHLMSCLNDHFSLSFPSTTWDNRRAEMNSIAGNKLRATRQ